MKKYFQIIAFLFLFVMIMSINGLHIKAKTNTVYKEYKVGDVIKFDNEDYYVIIPSDDKLDYVTLLKAEPLKLELMNDLIKSTELKNSIQNNNGYGEISYSSVETCGYMNGSWGDTNCSNDYDSSSLKQILTVWANKFDDKLKEDKLGYKVRLLTIDDLIENLDYIKNAGGTGYYVKDKEVPTWMYGEYDYWTMSVEEDNDNSNWNISKYGGIISTASVSSFNAVRPVINVLKSTIDGEMIIEEPDVNTEKVNSPNTLMIFPIIPIIIGGLLIILGILMYIIVTNKKKK